MRNTAALCLASLAFSLLGGSSGQATDHKPAQAISRCDSAKAMIAGKQTRIDIVATCQGDRKAHPFDVTISREATTGAGAPPGIRAFKLRPRLIGKKGPQGSASCKRMGRDVHCEGRTVGYVEMRMAIEVSAKSRCQLDVSVTSYEGSRCPGRVCPVQEAVRVLWSGRPRGC